MALGRSRVAVSAELRRMNGKVAMLLGEARGGCGWRVREGLEHHTVRPLGRPCRRLELADELGDGAGEGLAHLVEAHEQGVGARHARRVVRCGALLGGLRLLARLARPPHPPASLARGARRLGEGTEIAFTVLVPRTIGV